MLPVNGAARNPFLGARAILVLTDLGRRPARPEASLLAAAFDLTPAEARVAALLTTGASLEQAASQLGVSVGTLRFQLRAVFAKTGTGRQADLLTLLARL